MHLEQIIRLATYYIFSIKKMSRGQDDPRFSKVFSDPRFRTVRKKDLKVQLDDRFNKKDLKKDFTLLKSRAKVDKYGRKIKENNDIVDNLDKYYNDQEDGDDDESVESENSADDSGKSANDISEPSSDSDDQNSEEEIGSRKEDDDDGDEEESGATQLDEDPLAIARGLIGNDSDLDTTSDEESDEEDEEVEASVESEDEKEKIPEQEPTNRIAVVNLDWDHLKSSDLFATFNSFLPKDGAIQSVTIYKSQYGKERLADEEINGPPKEIFKPLKEDNESDDDDGDSDDDDLDVAKASKKLIEENNGEESFDSTALRKYQLQRLRYYYAIVEFNTTASAIEIYKACDGTEFESSGNFFDLRYVPNEMEFDDTDIRDSCTKLTTNYQPIEFSTDSLRNSKPKLTWDETPIERVQILTKSFKQGELDDLDLKNYLASDSEDEQVEDSSINKYKQLVGNLSSKKSDSENGEDDEGEDDVDMEITFTPGASITEKAKKEEELSAIEKLRAKEKERRKARKQKIKELKKQSQQKKSRRNNEDTDENKEANELVMDHIGSEAAELDHFNMKDVEKLEKLKNKKNKHKNKRQREQERELEERLANHGNEKLEIDERFSEMLDNHAFVGGSALLQQERKKRKKEKKH